MVYESITVASEVTECSTLLEFRSIFISSLFTVKVLSSIELSLLLIVPSLLVRVSHNLKTVVNVLSVKATCWFIFEAGFIVIDSSLVFSDFSGLTFLLLFLGLLVRDIRFVFDSKIVIDVWTHVLSVFVGTFVLITFARAEKFRGSLGFFFFLLFLLLLGFLNRCRAKIDKIGAISFSFFILLRLGLLSVSVQVTQRLEVVPTQDAFNVSSVAKLRPTAAKLNIICVFSRFLDISTLILLIFRNHVVRHLNDILFLR